MSSRKRKQREPAKMLSLNIGENDPVGNQLVSIEMDQVARTKFRKAKPSRKESIDRIFGDMVKVDASNEVAAEKARQLMGLPKPRKSMLPTGLSPLALSPNDEAPGRHHASRKMSFSPGARLPQPGFETEVDDVILK